MARKAIVQFNKLGDATPEEVKQQRLQSFGLKIKHYRNQAGLTAEQLAEKLGISRSAVRNWECGISRPDPELFYPLFTILDIEPNEFFGIKGIGTILTDNERTLIKNYRLLDDTGKEDLEIYADAMSEKSHLRLLQNAKNNMRYISDYSRRASAGKGDEWDDHPNEEQHILLLDSIVAKADEIITVNGDSMEPQFHHGDRVLVQYCETLNYGDIGIFYVSGYGGVIKQVAHDRLHSLNPDYDDIFPYEEGAKIIGKVLGVVTTDMIPTNPQRNLFIEALETLSDGD